MSSKLPKSDGIPSNDEIVDSLVKDFESSCQTEKADVSPGECNPEPTIEEELEKLEDDTETEEKTTDKPEDFVDEEAMKELELSYSEEDKERLRGEAEDLKKKGNLEFKANELKESILTYTQGLRTCPLEFTKDRSIMYANRAAAKVKLSMNETAVEDCTKAIELDDKYVRALLRRAQLYEIMEKLDESLEDFKKVIELDPSNAEAIMATQRLPPMINERNEKLKTEMMGKLKDLGNLFLRPFGLSTDNLQMVQDPNSGGYSFSFKSTS